MSLDVSLYLTEYLTCECRKKHELKKECVFEANITHNLTLMAEKAGIYKHLWRPEEIDISKAKELIDPLTKGLDDMRARPEYYKKFDSPNGWGLYKHFVPWLQNYLNACKEFPNAIIEISR